MVSVKRIVIVLILATILIATPVLAAAYTGQITITEANDTAYTMLPVKISAGISGWVTQGYISSTGLDVSMDSTPFMLANDKMLFVKTVPAKQTITANLTTGNSPASAFNIVLGNGGYFVIAQNAPMQGNAFEIEIKGYFDALVVGGILDCGVSYPRLRISAAGNLKYENAGAGPVDLNDVAFTSGIHTIKVVDDDATTKLYVDGIEKDSDVNGAFSIPAAGVTVMGNGASRYWEYYKHTVGGTLIAWYQPIAIISGTTLPDREGVAQNGTITWGDNPAGITASLTSFQPTSQLRAESFILVGETTIFTEIPDPVEGMYEELSEEGFSRVPGSEAVNTLLDEGEIPQALWWFPFLFFGIAVVGLMVYDGTTRAMYQGQIVQGAQSGSALFMSITIEALFVAFGILGVLPLWPAFLFPIPAGAMIISQKQTTWG